MRDSCDKEQDQVRSSEEQDHFRSRVTLLEVAFVSTVAESGSSQDAAMCRRKELTAINTSAFCSATQMKRRSKHYFLLFEPLVVHSMPTSWLHNESELRQLTIMVTTWGRQQGGEDDTTGRGSETRQRASRPSQRTRESTCRLA